MEIRDAYLPDGTRTGAADCDKAAVTLQEEETIAYRWVTEFAAFVNSERMIDTQRTRFQPFLRRMGYAADGKENTCSLKRSACVCGK